MRDDRPAGSQALPAVWFAYSPDRRARHCAEHLEHVGGVLPRKVWFHPLTGRARVKELKSTATNTVADREQQYATRIGSDAKGGDIELF